MATICLYQDTRHEKPLYWMRKKFGIGYVSKRNDGMSELRINGFTQVRKILVSLQPFIRFKKKQTSALIKACQLLEKKSFAALSDTQLKAIIDLAFAIKNANYRSRGSLTKEELCQRLGLTP